MIRDLNCPKCNSNDSILLNSEFAIHSPTPDDAVYRTVLNDRYACWTCHEEFSLPHKEDKK